jgi:hypothetical protein
MLGVVVGWLTYYSAGSIPATSTIETFKYKLLIYFNMAREAIQRDNPVLVHRRYTCATGTGI